jgi:protoheme IX farnesyltransferase
VALLDKLLAYVELSKPRIAVLALVAVAVGYTLGSAGQWYPVPLFHALIGTALVAVGSSALNQWLERDTDTLMNRTEARPLPSGRLQPAEVLRFGLLTAIGGCLYVAIAVNWLTCAACVTTVLLYVLVYTPLKRKTSLCTAVGAIPGALPPVLGWTAAGGQLDQGAFALFALLFMWQFPHFLAIAWIYRHDYANAGLKMLPESLPRPYITGLMCTLYAILLLPVSLLPSEVALAGNMYAWAAVILGIGYLICSVRFMLHETIETARGLLWASLIYLPLLLLILTWDHLQLLS